MAAADLVQRILLIGPPGSGKGTQALRLSQKYQIGHVSTGDILRRNTQKGTALGREAQQFITSGDLVPDRLIFDMLEDLYKRADGEHQGFILDGFPRSENQAEALSEFLESRGQRVSAVLLLELADDEIVERLVHRRTCSRCGRSYHLKSSPPTSEGVCDGDGTSLVWREDDHEDVIRHRLQTYHGQTEPVVAFYGKRGVLHRIDACQSIESVTLELSAIMDRLAHASRGDSH